MAKEDWSSIATNNQGKQQNHGNARRHQEQDQDKIHRSLDIMSIKPLGSDTGPPTRQILNERHIRPFLIQSAGQANLRGSVNNDGCQGATLQ